MRRASAILLIILAIGLAVAPAFGQEQVNPLDPIFDFFNDSANEEFVAQFLKDPVEGKTHVEDPDG